MWEGGEGIRTITTNAAGREGVELTPGTFVALLNACASIGSLEKGRHIHKHIIQRGFQSDVLVGSSLVDMYIKCGSIDEEMSIRNVVSWNAMILGYVKYGQGQKALELFEQMECQGVDPSPFTFVGVLNACASLGAFEKGRDVHKQVIQRGCESDVFVGGSLVDMYAKCGSIDDVWTVFKSMPKRNVVSWNAMILGHVKCGQSHKALELSHQMEQEGVVPDTVTFLGMLTACAGVSALEEGQQVHEQIIQRGCELDVFVSSSLVDMYAKCGSIDDAWRVFNEMPTHNLVSWTALIQGYAMRGNAEEALENFERMCQEGVEVDGVTFVAILSACSHAGLVDEGLDYFESMTPVHNIYPTVEHYACIIDLLGRAGHLNDAENLIKAMSCEPDATVWMCLLGACRVHGNVEMGEHTAKQFVELFPEDPSGYVLLSDIYAAAGRWDSRATINQVRLERCVKKKPLR